MESLHIESGSYTPEIVLNPDKNVFSIKGKSFPINPISFFQPVFEWFTNFINNSHYENDIVVDFDFEYINTSSSRQIAKLFNLFDTSPFKEKVIINWQYFFKDIDMLEAGERYQKFTGLKFNFNAITQ